MNVVLLFLVFSSTKDGISSTSKRGESSRRPATEFLGRNLAAASEVTGEEGSGISFLR
jgi:hypothetical protein